MDDSPLWWPAEHLVGAYRNRVLSPVEVAEMAGARIAEIDGELHAYTLATAELALAQAQEAERAYAEGDPLPLSGVPVSVKDAFHIEGLVTTLGSLAHCQDVVAADSGAVRRLRRAGAVFVGKTNVPEFCQSATCDNLLGPETGNPWDLKRTSGGSSGGAAASVAAGTCTLALGSDGGGSIRIPAAFCGLVGFKPTLGSVSDEGGFNAFSRFISAGPLARSVADAGLLDSVLRDERHRRVVPTARLRVGWCAAPEASPVDPAVATVFARAVEAADSIGHTLREVDLAIDGWKSIFDPLVLEEEGRRRGHLLRSGIRLTRYERRSLEAAEEVTVEQIRRAENELRQYRIRVEAHFSDLDVVMTPATAVVAFEKGQRPSMIHDRPVSRLWGAFPFAVPFNVSAHPAIVIPAGFVDGLPVGVQLIAGLGRDHELLAAAAQLEAAMSIDPFRVMRTPQAR